MTLRRRDCWGRCAGAFALALVLAGCLDEKKPLATQPPPEPMPVPVTPVKAIRAIEWCWDHLDAGRLATLLSDDYIFSCSAADSAGNPFRNHGLARLDELESARHLFIGGGSVAPATAIALQLDRNLISQPDSRQGKQNATYHQEILTSVVLRIETYEEEFQVTGAARFFMVRGDSALIPGDLAAGGAKPDSGRWYIQRWEDETIGSSVAAARAAARSRASALRAQPARSITWCAIKALYR